MTQNPNLLEPSSAPTLTPKEEAITAAALRSDYLLEKLLYERHGGDHAGEPKTFADNVNALPKLNADQQKVAHDVSEAIKEQVFLMQSASSEYQGRIETQKYTKKPLEKDEFTPKFIAAKEKTAALYADAVKRFPGLEEALHYNIHAALDQVKPAKHPHYFDTIVTDALPQPIAYMGRHNRLLQYGYKQSLWTDTVKDSKQTGITGQLF